MVMDAFDAVLFDLDGTLVDSVPDLAAAVDAMLAALGRAAAGEARVRSWVGNGAPMLVRRALTGCMQPATDAVPEGLYEQAFAGFMAAYSACSGQHSRLYPGVTDFLEQLREQELKLALITNKPGRFIPHLLRACALEGYFQQILGGDALPECKPHPAPLLHVARELGVEPSRCLMVGDSKNDVGAARAAGCPVACVTYGYNHGEPISAARPDWVVDSLLELL